jgi:hypothetical protein
MSATPLVNNGIAWLRSLHLCDVVFGILLLGFIIFRVCFYDFSFTLTTGEGTRDYVTSHFIVQGIGYTLSGPDNGILPGLGNSPLYYYLSSIPLFFFDSITSAAFFTVLLQALALCFIYFLTRNIFNPTAGLLAALLTATSIYMLSPWIMWAPIMMLPAAYGSFFLLERAYARSSLRLLTASFVLFIVACALHHSAAVLFLAYAAGAFFTLRKLNARPRVWLQLGLLGVILPFILYLPRFIFLALSHETLASVFRLESTYIFNENAHSAFDSSKHLLTQMHLPTSPESIILIFIICAVFFVLYLLTSHGREKGEYACLLLLAVIPVLLLPSGAHNHYLFAPTGFFIIFTAGCLIEILKSRGPQKIVAASLIIFLLAISTTYIDYILYKVEHHLITNGELLSRAVDAIALEVRELQRTYGYPHPDFFRVYGRQYDDVPLWDTIFLVPLEDRLQAPLMSFFSDFRNGNDNYWQPNKEDFIFLVCYSEDQYYAIDDCIKGFNRKFGYGGHTIEKTVFKQYGLEVVLLKRN